MKNDLGQGDPSSPLYITYKTYGDLPLGYTSWDSRDLETEIHYGIPMNVFFEETLTDTKNFYGIGIALLIYQ